MNKKSLCIIPARNGSKRIFKKIKKYSLINLLFAIQ